MKKQDCQQVHMKPRSRRNLLTRMGGIIAGLAAPSTLSSVMALPQDLENYVQVRNGVLLLHGKPFFVKGINYFGSWLDQPTINLGNGTEQANIWGMFHDWRREAVEEDFRFIRSQVDATVVRIGTPSEGEFAHLVKYHDYKPWYHPDGTASDIYLDMLIQLADVAYSNGIRIHFCLLWNVQGEIKSLPNNFWPKGVAEAKYSNQVRSISGALADHPGVLAYSIGNEVLIDWPINGTHRSWFEGIAAGFIERRIHDVRTAAPRHLITTDEVAAPTSQQWFVPGGVFATLQNIVTGTGYQSGRLAEWVDYIGLHFYGETLKGEITDQKISDLIQDKVKQLMICVEAARSFGKPLVLSEFGINADADEAESMGHAASRDRFFAAIIPVAERLGVQGILAWGALPELPLIARRHKESNLEINGHVVPEVDISDGDGAPRRVLYYDPFFNLFTLQAGVTTPAATPAAHTLAATWGAQMNR